MLIYVFFAEEYKALEHDNINKQLHQQVESELARNFLEFKIIKLKHMDLIMRFVIKTMIFADFFEMPVMYTEVLLIFIENMKEYS